MSKLTRLLACLLDCLIACLIACLLDCLLACLLDCLLACFQSFSFFFFLFFLFSFFLANNLHPTLSLLPNSYFGCVHFLFYFLKKLSGGIYLLESSIFESAKFSCTKC
jgi:NhaP-type Na+/H+ or K+/H+ antiporter